MKIPPGGREYVRIPATGVPTAAGTLEVSVDGGATWHATTWEGTGAERTARFLAASPTATANPAGTVVLAAGRNIITARLADTPEIVFRGVGPIDVT